MPKQPPRFLFRTRAISDLALSDGAQRLYMLLDDEARGETSLHLKQLRLAVTLGISTRELQFRIGELEASKYLTIRRTIHGNRYEFVWKDTNAGSQADANHISPSMRTPVHMLPITQEAQEPLTPLSLREETQTPDCPRCYGLGYVLVRVVVRGMGSQERRTCSCVAERRSA